MGRVIHFEIHCGDLDRAERFYREVMGWEIQRYAGAPVDYRLITTGPDGEPGINGALVGRRGDTEGQFALLAYVNTIQVGDLDETQRRVLEHGGEVALERDDVPGVGALAYFKDSEGNVFGALQP